MQRYFLAEDLTRNGASGLHGFVFSKKKPGSKIRVRGKRKNIQEWSGVGLASQGLQLVRDRRPFGVTVFKIRLQDLVFSQCLF